MNANTNLPAIVLAALVLLPVPASASELSYTFMDFLAIDTSVDAAGVQTPVPGQTVSVDVDGGDGVSVAGSLGLGGRFYLTGAFKTSIIDFEGVIESPLTTTRVSDTFDLVMSTFGVGYQYELDTNFDLIGELTYDTVDYDFGSLAGENFDTNDEGIGGRVGFRWNPRPPLEVFASARHTPVGQPRLSDRELDSDTLLDVGMRWYFFEDLGLGFQYEAGDVSTATISMRFSFGNLPW